MNGVSSKNGPSVLGADQLRRECDPTSLDFETTADLVDGDAIVGQERALEALRFGLRMRGDGYNIFALGPSGTGRLTAARRLVEVESARSESPPDWCYVYNFSEPNKPNAIRLPAGIGSQLRRDMDRFVDDVQVALPAAFESEDYRVRVEEVEQSIKDKQQRMMEEVSDQARTQNLSLIHTQTGFAFAPLKENGEVMPPDEFLALSEEERRRIETATEAIQQTLQRSLRQVPQWAKEGRDRIKAINRDIAKASVDHILQDLRKTYEQIAELSDYLEAVAKDVIENVDSFLPQQHVMPTMMPGQSAGRDAMHRYQVNLLVDNSSRKCAPVVFEDLPSYTNLIGRCEYQAQMGTLTTNFTLIRPGALHRANGGFLILDARQVLIQPMAWDGLKRAMQAHEIRLDSLERSFSLISTVSLEPEHIPLNVKVVLIGDRQLYYLLSQFDPNFNDLFKVMADFDDVCDRDASADLAFARLIAQVCRENSLLPLNRPAVARVIEQASRYAEDASKLSTHLASISDLLREADHWAREEKADIIDAAHVQNAVDQLCYRAERVRERQYESIARGTILIDTAGEAIGQVNALSVLQLGRFRFGQPTRITATTRNGNGQVVDIERESRLGGPIHSKGVMILTGLLTARYAGQRPLSMSASIVFEQSYGMVEGDSASLAELCAVISSLSRLPIRQSFALTGSVNQHGEVQPIGGVNEKVEGFFDVCRGRGLSGDQAVIIPAANVQNLMLRSDLVAAVTDGKFQIYPVANVDQALELLTGQPAGQRDTAGIYGPGTVNGRAAARLNQFRKTQDRAAGARSTAARR